MEKSKIQWNGKIDPDSEGAADNNEVPSSVDIVWGGYKPCWYPANHADCVLEDMYFEDFDIFPEGNPDGALNTYDSTVWANSYGRGDIQAHIIFEIIIGGNIPDKAPESTYTWGDVAFVLEIFDGIGTGSRRSREARLQELDKDKKKRLIHLICRVKGEKVYDEKKMAGDIQIKLEDAELVIERILGKMTVENANVL